MSFTDFSSETLILPLIKREGEVLEIPEYFKSLVQPVVDLKDFNGKLGEIITIYPEDNPKKIKRILLLGLGKYDNFNSENIRRAFGKAGNHLRKNKIIKTGIYFTNEASQYSESVFEGLYLGNYRFLNYKTKENAQTPPLREIFAVTSDEDKELIEKAEAYALAGVQGTNLARDLGNTPSNDATPAYLAKEALELQKLGLKITVLDTEAIKKENMRLFLAVAQGSIEADPPKFIIMDYSPEKPLKTLCLVGKGITFDTGGISLKAGSGMEEMKFDMCGAGTVIGAMKTIALIKPKIRVVGLVPATPNMPDAKAYRPSDIITTRSGKKVEIISTDAEGRNILADALDYAKEFKPDLVFDFATLTGACVVALGHYNGGFFMNEKAEELKELKEIVFKAGRESGDFVWNLPLDDDYFEYLKSPYADFKHTGGRWGGSITAAMFLSQFTQYPWIHFDIAGMAWKKGSVGKKKLYNSKDGATGFGVRLISEFIRKWV
ncbi:MAG: leucyl aminopeptidase [Candidatus Hodarchaeales archaeon]